jgi:hypothetical protein
MLSVRESSSSPGKFPSKTVKIGDTQTLCFWLIKDPAGIGQAVGKAGDEGIDGVISEDRLGLDIVTYRPSGGRAPLAGPRSRNS